VVLISNLFCNPHALIKIDVPCNVSSRVINVFHSNEYVFTQMHNVGLTSPAEVINRAFENINRHQ